MRAAWCGPRVTGRKQSSAKVVALWLRCEPPAVHHQHARIFRTAFRHYFYVGARLRCRYALHYHILSRVFAVLRVRTIVASLPFILWGLRKGDESSRFICMFLRRPNTRSDFHIVSAGFWMCARMTRHTQRRRKREPGHMACSNIAGAPHTCPREPVSERLRFCQRHFFAAKY